MESLLLAHHVFEPCFGEKCFYEKRSVSPLLVGCVGPEKKSARGGTEATERNTETEQLLPILDTSKN